MSTRYEKPIWHVAMQVETDKGLKRVDLVVAARTMQEAQAKVGPGNLVEARLLPYDTIVVD